MSFRSRYFREVQTYKQLRREKIIKEVKDINTEKSNKNNNREGGGGEGDRFVIYNFFARVKTVNSKRDKSKRERSQIGIRYFCHCRWITAKSLNLDMDIEEGELISENVIRRLNHSGKQIP